MYCQEKRRGGWGWGQQSRVHRRRCHSVSFSGPLQSGWFWEGRKILQGLKRYPEGDKFLEALEIWKGWKIFRRRSSLTARHCSIWDTWVRLQYNAKLTVGQANQIQFSAMLCCDTSDASSIHYELFLYIVYILLLLHAGTCPTEQAASFLVTICRPPQLRWCSTGCSFSAIIVQTQYLCKSTEVSVIHSKSEHNVVSLGVIHKLRNHFWGSL